MKIAHILWGLGTGGIETMTPDIANEQAKEHKVSLLIINNNINASILSKISSNVNVHCFNRQEGSKSIWPIVKLNLALVRIKPDIIHTHSYRAINLVLYPFGKRIRTIHNTYNISSEYPRYDKLIAISKAVQEFTTHQGFTSVIVDNGIPTTNIVSNRTNTFCDGKLHFIQVSRFYIKQKGQDILIRALAKVVSDGKTDFVMHFVGEGDDKPLLQQLVAELGLQEYVVFEGLKTQEWIYQNLCNYDLFIQPSRFEGFGLTVAEAIAAKVPVLVSEIEGPLEIISGGEFGRHFKNEDVDDCANNILYFIKHGRNEIQVEDAYKHIKEKYDVSITANGYCEIYKKVLNKKS